MDARNQEYEGDQQCTYAVHINNNTIRKESQSPIREVLARSCWRVGPGQEASDGSKVRREGKAGPFIPYEVQAQTGPAQATTPADSAQVLSGNHSCRRSGKSVSARATTSMPGRQCMCSGDNVCACATTSTVWEGCFFTNTPNFSARATTSASGQQHLRLGDNVRARATMSGTCVHDQGWFCLSKLQI